MRCLCVVFFVLLTAAVSFAAEPDYPHLIDMGEIDENAVYEKTNGNG